MAPICNPSTRENEARGLLQVQGQPALHNEIQTSQGYRVRALSQFLKKNKNFRKSKKFFSGAIII